MAYNPNLALFFNIRDFGAVGDGTTDDSTAIAAAYTAARAVNGTVFFPPGKTYINGTTINPLGTTTSGYGAILKHKPTMTAVNMYQSGSASFLGLTIDLNKANTTDPGSNTQGIGIYLFHATALTQFVVRDVTINNGFQVGLRIATGVTITDSANAPSAGGVVANYKSDACKYSLWMQKVGSVQVTGGQCTNSGDSSIFIYQTNNITINGANVSGSVAGHGIVFQYTNDCAVSGCIANSNALTGICFGGGDPTLTQNVRFAITGNTCRNNANHGISVDPTKTGAAGVVQPSYASITGNVCNSNSLHGIYMHNMQYGTCTGNTCNGNTNHGIATDSADLTIDGNTTTNNTQKGISINGNISSPNCARISVSGNSSSGNGTGNYYVESTYVSQVFLNLDGNGSPEGSVAAPVGSTYRRLDGSSGTTLYIKETGTITNTGWRAAPSNADIQVFTSSGTWTKPAGVTTVRVVAISGGGGGGSGRRGAAGTVRCGGGGGGGGSISERTLAASLLTGTVTVTVGTGGTGGAAQTVDATDGIAGTVGIASAFGVYIRAGGPGGGGGGTASSGTAGNSGLGLISGGLGAAASTTGGIGGNATAIFSPGAAGGAGGGGITSADVANAGGNGSGSTAANPYTVAGGIVDTTPPVAATAAAANLPVQGGSGGGGAASITTAAQAGAAGGIYGGGGSGGGASLNGNASGAGGNGGPGIVVVIST